MQQKMGNHLMLSQPLRQRIRKMCASIYYPNIRKSKLSKKATKRHQINKNPQILNFNVFLPLSVR